MRILDSGPVPACILQLPPRPSHETLDLLYKHFSLIKGTKIGQTLPEKMQKQISEKLEDVFEIVVKQKHDYYQNNPAKIPVRGAISSLISSTALTNSAISGGASLVPGPWGMLAVVPELILVSRNQIALIYDIAAANDQKDIMTKELAAMVFVSAMGSSAGAY